MFLILIYAQVPNMVDEHIWHDFKSQGWKLFFKGTNGMLQPYEECDCSHYDGRIFEHRSYFDPFLNITVKYIMYRGFFIEGTNNSNSLYAPVPQTLSAPMWAKKIDIYLNDLIKQKVSIDYFVVNVGFFGFHASVNQSNLIFQCRQIAPKVIWKTTTYRLNENHDKNYDKKNPVNREKMNEVDSKMCNLQDMLCLDTSWTAWSNRMHYWNDIHFLEPIYNMLNSQLIDLIARLG